MLWKILNKAIWFPMRPTQNLFIKKMYNLPFTMKFIVTKLVLPDVNVVAFISTMFDLWMSP
jgi:hypothetical protein